MKIIRKIVNSAGYETIEVRTGEEALEMVPNTEAGIIFLDLVLPDYSGFELLDAFRKMNVKAPIVVVSADIQVSSQEKCKELGAVDFIHKPVKEDDIVNAINKYAS
jgi:CheY-like chemotaxis protein